MIKILLGNVNCRIIGDLTQDVMLELDSHMSYKFNGYQFLKGGRGGYALGGKYGGWDGIFHLFTKDKDNCDKDILYFFAILK